MNRSRPSPPASPGTPRIRLAPALLACAAALACLTGCSKEEIRVYQVANTRSAPPSAESEREHLHWELPEGWTEKSASGARAANFTIAGPDDQHAEVAIMPFSRMGGSDLDFVNLWRSTLGLDPVDATRLPSMVQPVRIGEDQGQLYDVMQASKDAAAGTAAEPPRAHMVVARVIRNDTSWFFKLAGDAALVNAQIPAFKSFLETITFHGADAHDSPGATSGSGSAAASDNRAASVPAALDTSSDGAKPAWTVPAHWTELPPTSMVLAKFIASGDDADQRAEITVSVLLGSGGGLVANINRWRGQVGLPPIEDTELSGQYTTFEADGAQAMLVDMTGPAPESRAAPRLITAILPRGGQTWFYKLLADAPLAEKEKGAFLQFVQSARHPND